MRVRVGKSAKCVWIVSLVSLTVCVTITISFKRWPYSTRVGEGSYGLSRETTRPLLTGYVLANTYRDQLTMAMVHFYQLVEIASHWNMTTVEPSITATWAGLKGLPSPEEEHLSFPEVFNISLMHGRMDKCLALGGKVPTCSLLDFLVNATERRFISLTFVKLRDKPAVFDCTSLPAFSTALRDIEHKLNRRIETDADIRRMDMFKNNEDDRMFKGVKAICVNGWDFSILQVTSMIAATARRLNRLRVASPAAVNIIIPEWRLIQTASKSSLYYYDPTFPWRLSRGCSLANPPVSKIIHAADNFTSSLNLSRPILGIHLRIERLSLTRVKSQRPRYWEECMDTLEAAVRSLQSKYGIRPQSTVAIHDRGQYGSVASCPWPCTLVSQDIASLLEKLGVRVVHYEPASLGGSTGRISVSIIEKEFLSQVDYLVTVGCGSFQKSLIDSFLEKHNNTDFHVSVCDCNTKARFY